MSNNEALFSRAKKVIPGGVNSPVRAFGSVGGTPRFYVGFLTDKGTRKERLLAENVRISVCVQDEKPPYRYVSIEGPIVSIEPADLERDARPMARRYLGIEGGDCYTDTESAPAIDNAILVKVRPEHWLSAEYGDD